MVIDPFFSDKDADLYKSIFGEYGEMLVEDNMSYLSEYDIADIKKIFTYNSIGSYYPIEQELENIDLLISGCSETKADILDSESTVYRWGDILSKSLNCKSANIAVNGCSVYQIVNSCMIFFSKYGKPKRVALLLPNLERFTMPSNSFVLNKRYNFYDVEITQDLRWGDVEKYVKIPNTVNKYMHPIVALYYNLQSILFLEEYCKVAGIELVYSTWDYNCEYIISKLKNISNGSYSNFISTKAEFKDRFKHEDFGCHDELKLLAQDKFYTAKDNEHMGVHRHQHIADIFEMGFKK